MSQMVRLRPNCALFLVTVMAGAGAGAPDEPEGASLLSLVTGGRGKLTWEAKHVLLPDAAPCPFTSALLLLGSLLPDRLLLS